MFQYFSHKTLKYMIDRHCHLFEFYEKQHFIKCYKTDAS